MRYLFLFFIFLSVDAVAEFTHYSFDMSRAATACPFGYENEIQMGSSSGDYSKQLELIEYYGAVHIGTRTSHYSGVDNKGNSWSSTTDDAIYVSEGNCAKNPKDDSHDEGCFPADAGPDGYCSDTKDCPSGSGSSFKLSIDKNCSDYCPGPSPEHGRGSVHRCSDTGDGSDEPSDDDWADDHCADLMVGRPGWSCSQDPNDSDCVNYGLNGLEFKSCRGDDNDNSDGNDGGDPGDGDNNDGSDSDGDGIPDGCMDEYNAALDDCPVNLPGWSLTLVSAQACTFQCNPPSTDPDDGDSTPDDGNDNSNPGDGDSGDDGDNDDGNDSGGDSGDDNDNSNGGGDPDDDEPQQGDPLSIDGFDSLQEKVAAKRQEYLDEFDEYRAKFADLIDLSPNNAGSPFEDNYIELFGVQVNFGTAILEPGLRYLPSIILFCAVFTGACIVLGGPKS